MEFYLVSSVQTSKWHPESSKDDLFLYLTPPQLLKGRRTHHLINISRDEDIIRGEMAGMQRPVLHPLHTLRGLQVLMVPLNICLDIVHKMITSLPDILLDLIHIYDIIHDNMDNLASVDKAKPG